MTKITALTADTTPTSDDLIVTVNDPGGTPANRKVTLANLLSALFIAVKNVQQTFTKSQGSQATTITSSGTVAIDGSLSNVFRITLGSSNTISNPTSLVDGFTYLFTLVQDGTGSRTVSWGTNYDFGTAGAPTLTTTASKKDILSFLSDGTKLYFCGIQKGFS